MKPIGMFFLLPGILGLLMAIIMVLAEGDEVSNDTITAIYIFLLSTIIGGILVCFGKLKEKAEEERLAKQREKELVDRLKSQILLERWHQQKLKEQKESGQVTEPTIYDLLSELDDGSEEYPKPMFAPDHDEMEKLMSEKYRDDALSIIAEGGTKEQTKVKFEVLLGKRKKTKSMLAVERLIRDALSKFYEEVYKDTNEDGGQYDVDINRMIEIANKFGVSVNLIDKEERQKAESKYS